MNIENLREFCLSLPHVTEDIKWGKDLCFSVGGKLFCACGLEQSDEWQFSFKCTPEKFSQLIELDGISPAPYVARYHWVAVSGRSALADSELEDLLSKSYLMVFQNLPANVRQALGRR